MAGFCPIFTNKKIKEQFNQLVTLVGENKAYYLWDKYQGDFLLAEKEAKLIKDVLDSQSTQLANLEFNQRYLSAQQELANILDDYHQRGYGINTRDEVESQLHRVRAKLLSGMESLLKSVDSISTDKTDEFKANLRYMIANLRDNTIDDVENIVYFVKSLASDLAPIAQEILNAAKNSSTLSNERIYALERNYFGFYNPLIRDIRNVFDLLEPFSELMGKDQYRYISDLIDSSMKILEFSRYNLRRMLVENFKIILSRAINQPNINLQFAEEVIRLINDKYALGETNYDIWMITRAFSSPDKVKDPILKTLYMLVLQAENKKAERVFAKAFELNEAAKGVDSFTDFYEKDDDGKPTGYLVRDKKHGKFRNDYHKFLNKLRMQFGLEPNSQNLPDDPDARKAFSQAKNEYLSHYVERRYTNEFYLLFDNLSTEAQYAREQIEIRIRTILDKYIKLEGYLDESKMIDEDKQKLAELRVEKKLLASKWNPDGTEKTGIERLIAEELTELLKALSEDYVTVKDKARFDKIVAQKKEELSKEEFDEWYRANTKTQYSLEFKDELKKLDKLRFGEEYARLAEKRNDMLAPYRDPKTNEPLVDLMPIETKRAINRLEIAMSLERKKNKDKKVDTSSLFTVVPTSQYLKKLEETKKLAEQAATVNGVVDPFMYELLMESMFYGATSHRTPKGWEPNSYYTKIVPVNPKHLEVVPNDSFNTLSPDSKFYNKNYDYSSGEYYQPKAYATSDFKDQNGKLIKKGTKLYDNSQAYNKVMSDPKKRLLYQKILETMKEANSYYTNRPFMDEYKLPQIDGSVYRYMKSKGFWSGIWNKIASFFGRRADDVGIQEKAAASPDGLKLGMIPQYFVKDLEDPSSISADLLGIIMEYYLSAVNYDEKNKIRADVETIKAILSRRTHHRNLFGKSYDIAGTETDLYKMADGFIDIHIYGLQTSVFRLKLLGREFDITKLVGLVKKAATAINLMCNWVVAATGFFTSGYLMLVQTLVGRYYDVNDTLNALRFFITDMFWSGIKNIGNRHYKSKVQALMDEFGVGGELSSLWKNSNHNGVVSAIVRKLGWWGMTVSDYIVKGLILAAVLYNYKYVNGEFLSKEDYFAKYGRTSITKNRWKNYISAMDSIEFKNGKITTKDPHVLIAWNNAKLFIANTARVLAASADGQLTPLLKAQITTNVFGALTMMHRLYLPVVVSERFTMTYQYDPNLNRYREAVLLTVFRFVKLIALDRQALGLLNSVSSNWKKFSGDVVAKANLRLALWEALLLTKVLPSLMMFMLQWADEDDDSWWKKFLAYVAMRTKFESTSPYNMMDLYNTIKTPTPAFGAIDATINTFQEITKFMSEDYDDEIKKGAYKDKSKLFRYFMKMTPLKNMYEQVNDIDSKIRYYQNQIMKDDIELEE